MSDRMFRIWVEGRLKEGFARGIDPGISQEEAVASTTLSGQVVDQAQLHGLLEQLRQLGVEVTRFETYPKTSEANPSSGRDPIHRQR